MKALYPGTFDPITNGHLDIIDRAGQLFDSLIVAVAEGVHKETHLSLATRKRLVQTCTKGKENISVISFTGLLAKQCERLKVKAVIRGLRAVSDFEYELMMALMNRKLNPGFETIFLMPSEQNIYLHSSLVCEIFSLGGDISCLVPESVHKALVREMKPKRKSSR
jgi:pantetheine-phosphate adenylyltransferase